ncbi:PREDICTED: serine/arginine repetitive matrix protein 2-like, partial [Dipodomys ordii]|uniref:Serine/arginine repetitive matrix protein 2-like n=1 Tax=Dipodomys ordii TaxID=10020 RepID=A0A1S3GW17_DIPOR
AGPNSLARTDAGAERTTTRAAADRRCRQGVGGPRRRPVGDKSPANGGGRRRRQGPREAGDTKPNARERAHTRTPPAQSGRGQAREPGSRRARGGNAPREHNTPDPGPGRGRSHTARDGGDDAGKPTHGEQEGGAGTRDDKRAGARGGAQREETRSRRLRALGRPTPERGTHAGISPPSPPRRKRTRDLTTPNSGAVPRNAWDTEPADQRTGNPHRGSGGPPQKRPGEGKGSSRTHLKDPASARGAARARQGPTASIHAAGHSTHHRPPLFRPCEQGPHTPGSSAPEGQNPPERHTTTGTAAAEHRGAQRPHSAVVANGRRPTQTLGNRVARGRRGRGTGPPKTPRHPKHEAGKPHTTRPRIATQHRLQGSATRHTAREAGAGTDRERPPLTTPDDGPGEAPRDPPPARRGEARARSHQRGQPLTLKSGTGSGRAAGAHRGRAPANPAAHAASRTRIAREPLLTLRVARTQPRREPRRDQHTTSKASILPTTGAAPRTQGRPGHTAGGRLAQAADNARIGNDTTTQPQAPERTDRERSGSTARGQSARRGFAHHTARASTEHRPSLSAERADPRTDNESREERSKIRAPPSSSVYKSPTSRRGQGERSRTRSPHPCLPAHHRRRHGGTARAGAHGQNEKSGPIRHECPSLAWRSLGPGPKEIATSPHQSHRGGGEDSHTALGRRRPRKLGSREGQQPGNKSVPRTDTLS